MECLLQKEGERSPQEVRSFASSVGLGLWRRVLRSITQEVRSFASSVDLGLWRRVSANDRPEVVNVRTAEEENDCCRAEYETCKENQFFEKLKYENKHK
jgi:hypothetical protein